MAVTTADTPTRADIKVWRGDSAPSIVWQFSDIVLGGSVFELTAYSGADELFSLSSDDGDLVLDTDALTVTWPPLGAQTVLIPPGPTAQYKLRRVLSGNRQTVAYGYFIGSGGDSFDV